MLLRTVLAEPQDAGSIPAMVAAFEEEEKIVYARVYETWAHVKGLQMVKINP